MVTIRSRGRLPHWEDRNAIYFVTFRLADSLPETARRRIEFERQDIIRTAHAMNRAMSVTEQMRLPCLSRKKIEAMLDAGAGSCWLAQPKIARIATDTLKHFDGIRYRLLAWCVMPNHVHVLFQPSNAHYLADVIQSWKSYSAKASNRVLGRSGEFWEREYFDHIARNQSEINRIVRYIRDNLKKARLRDWPWVECTLEYK